MSYIVRIYDGNHLTDLPLKDENQYTIGAGEQDHYSIMGEAFQNAQVVFFKENDRWIMEAKEDVFFGDQPVNRSEIKSGDIYIVGTRRKISLWIYEMYSCEAKKLELSGMQEISFGRSRKCDVVFSNRRVSARHAKMYRMDGGWHLCDLNSSNGTYVNGVRIQDVILRDGDAIQFSTFTIVFYSDRLLLVFDQDEVEISPELIRIRMDETEAIPYREYPHFKRSPRLKKEIPTGEIEIQAPPTVGTPPDINWLSVLLPPIAMVAIMAVVVVATKGSMMSLYYMAPMCLLSILMSVTTYTSQRKKHKKREQLRLDKYEEHIEETVQELEQKRKEQLDAVSLAHPSVSDCFAIVEKRKRRLWERRPDDNDFMDVRIGTGEIDFSMNIRIPKVGVTLDEDVLLNKPKEVYDKYRTVNSAPIILPVIKASTCGIIGNRDDSLRLLRNIVLQITTHHCYDDVKLVTLFSKEETEAFDWMKWLPHSFDDNRDARYMANDLFSSVKLLRDMEELLSQRSKELEEESNALHKTMKMPYYLFIIGERGFVEEHPILNYLLTSNPHMGVGSIFLFDDLSQLPKECTVIAEVHNGKGYVYHKENISRRKEFEIEKVHQDRFEPFARAMLPIRVAVDSEATLMPNSITFLEGYGVKRPEEINLETNWKSALTYKSMAVPIGVRANGEDFLFDIHEKKYGPHGLVAGMTGSGKSEMVQSWILSMALKFSPQDVSFVLIDFKGTGLILPFLNMPHLAGTISDLDTNINRNLIALENELSRRKALLDDAGVNNISAYLKIYKEGKVKEPLSFLFIIIDEFAEFKVQFPDFMTVINRVFAIGRTLGVFAILLTQKPAGVVDDKMHANTRFRWCLKVASSADSKEMLRHPDAAKITVPGRAYVQVGEDEVFELVQSYWSGAPYNPERKKSSSVDPKISMLGIRGERIVPIEQEKSVGFKSEINEIDVIVDFLDKYTKLNGIEKARKIWEPKMPDYIPLSNVLKCSFDGKSWPKSEKVLFPALGMIDDPHTQKQYPLELKISEDGHTVIYGAPGTGKTTLLQTLVMSICMTYPPEDVSVYIMDFGGWSMNIFKDYPHLGGIANDNDSERIEKLARLIAKEIETRKYSFAQEGVGNIKAYREITGEQLPYIVLVLDNFSPVLNLYPDLENFFITMTREGGNYGVYFIVTANNTMSLGYKISQNIKMALTLQLTDKSDYSSIVGKTGGMEPENCAGRGLVKGAPPLEFQTAVPVDGRSDSDRIARIRALGKEMDGAWTGNRAKPIPIMPEVISYRSITGTHPVIGLSVNDIEPISFSFAQIHYTIVSGKSGCGKSNLLQVIAKQMKEKAKQTQGSIEIIVFDSEMCGLKALETISDRYTTDSRQFDEMIANLIPLLQERREAYLGGFAKSFSPVLIVIDDLKSCFDSISDETARRLEAIIRLGKGLNVNLLVAGNCDEIRKLYNQGEEFTMGLVKGSQYILLGGRYTDHNCFKANIPYSEADTPLNEYEGYYVEHEKTVKFKTMYCQ